jgi:hypothetical protein
MPENILSTLLNQRAELSGQKSQIELQLEEVETKIKVYMTKNGLEKAENDYYKVSVRDDFKVEWLDRDAGMKYLEKQGLISQFMTEQFSAPKLKKYLESTGETINGAIELNPYTAITITAKKSLD